MDNESIKKNIVDLRMKSGLSQTEMAARLGISRTAYRNLENGNTHLLSESIGKIASVFHTSVEEIVLGYNPVVGGSKKLTDVYHEYMDKPLQEDYEAKLAETRAQYASLQEYVEALKEVIKSKDEIIAMMRSYGK